MISHCVYVFYCDKFANIGDLDSTIDGNKNAQYNHQNHVQVLGQKNNSGLEDEVQDVSVVSNQVAMTPACSLLESLEASL